jgi:hypothetical protein
MEINYKAYEESFAIASFAVLFNSPPDFIPTIMEIVKAEFEKRVQDNLFSEEFLNKMKDGRNTI